MAVRVIKKSWWVDFRFNHQRFRKRSPENSRAGAQTYEAALRQKLARGEEIGWKHLNQDQLFEQFAWRWYEEYVVPNNKYSEQLTKKYLLRASLIPFFGKTPIGRITTHQIERYKAGAAKTGVSNKTINNRLTILKTCLAAAHEWLNVDAPLPKIQRLKCVSARTDYLSSEECEKLLSNSNGVIHELILTALRTGMRLGELKGLQWTDIDWQNRILTVRHSRCDRRKVLTTPKSNRERPIPLDAEVYQIFLGRKETEGYVFLDTDHMAFDQYRLSHRLDAACKRSGIRRITWHVLRHTFASHLAMNGTPLSVVQSLLGHASIATTMRYAHVAPSAMRLAIDLLRPARENPVRLGQPVVNRWLERQLKRAA